MVTVSVGVRTKTDIRQVDKQILYLVVLAKFSNYLHHCLHLRINSQNRGHTYSIKIIQWHLVVFGADLKILHIGKGLINIHAQVVFELKAPILGARYALCQCLLSHIHRVVHSWDRLGCVAHYVRVYFRVKSDKLLD